jgi:N-sulfoglucosamine sulfohydrolase
MMKFVGLFLAALLCISTCPSEAEEFHVVVFLSDDHGQLDSTPYGATDVSTPNMQRLASEGMLFTQAFVASPSCAPSRAALLTGLMPARNGAEANHTYTKDTALSLPQRMKDLGFETAAFGKVAHGKKDIERHGFDTHDSRYDAEFVESFLRTRDASKKLCLFVGTHEPHVPWAENKGYDLERVNIPDHWIDTPETRSQRTRYYTDVTTTDSQLGQIMDLADKYLGSEKTLFLYTSDHGTQWPFGKWNLYDAGIRVPFIVRWPGHIAAASKSDAMIQWIDLLPTLIDLAGGRPFSKDPANGTSFAPVLLGKKTSHRSEIYTTHNNDGRVNAYPIRSVRTTDFKYILNLHPDWAHTTHIDQGLGSGDGWIYFLAWVDKAKTDAKAKRILDRYYRRPLEELYELATDPHEQINLAENPDYKETLEQLRQKMKQWMTEKGDTQSITVEPRLLARPDDFRPVDREKAGQR